MKVLIVGAFGFKKMLTGGQPVKTRELYYLLCDKYGDQNIEFIETKGWTKNPIRLIFQLYKKVKKCDTLIMLPAHNGLEVFGRIFAKIRKKSDKRVFYDVIGGWLPEKLKKDYKLRKILNTFDGIWVETSSMKLALNEIGMNNVTVIPNFKRLNMLQPAGLIYTVEPPFKFLTFSRVMKEKGIEDAINAITAINNKAGATVCSLDIYGHIDVGYAETFQQMQQHFPEYIKYVGCVSPNDSVEILKDYFALLFPTHYYTEGVPGTIIDAYAAGVPVITALWKNYEDVFEDDVTGLGYEFDNYEQFVALLEKVIGNPEILNSKKTKCLDKSHSFTGETVFELMIKDLEKDC